MTGCDWVINLANLYSFWEPHKSDYKKINVDGTRNVMECALEAGVSKVIHVSTVTIYGKPKETPFKEDSPVGSIRFSRYSQTKYEGDLIAWELYRNKKLPLVVIYPGAVLGAGDPKASGQYIRDFVRRKLPALVMEDSVLTFVHVADVAECIVRASAKPNNIGEKYIVGKYRLSFSELNQMIAEIANVPPPKFRLPDLLVRGNAYLLTAIANLIKKAPLWGMSVDQINIMRYGFRADGSKAERELGLVYTPIRSAVEEAVASFK